jgi:hypothetical protein
MTYCVYAFVDPTMDHEPFYIGYGTGNRWPDGTPDLSLDLTSGNGQLSYDIDAIFEAEMLDESNHGLHSRIDQVRSHGYGASDVVRVVARHLDHSMAHAVHQFLTTFAYSERQLANHVGALQSRVRRFGDWTNFHFDDGKPFDQYLYALRDPGTACVFYVGMGKKGRVWDHIRDARKAAPGLEATGRLGRTRALLEVHPKEAIARIIAHSLSADEAFVLESLAVKYLYGFRRLANSIRGRGAGRFRAKGDWTPRRGFELPLLINEASRGAPARIEQLETAIMNGYDQDLLEFKERSPGIAWEGPVLLDADDLSLRVKVTDSDGRPAAELKVFMRTNGFQIEIRGRTKEEKDWLFRHASENLHYPLRSLDVALERVRLMREWAMAHSRSFLKQAVGAEAMGELMELDPRLRGTPA